MVTESIGREIKMVTKEKAKKVSIYSGILIGLITYLTFSLIQGTVLVNSIWVAVASGIFAYWGMTSRGVQ